MRPIFLFIFVCVVSFHSFSQSADMYSASDRTTFTNMVNLWQWSWNHHNVDSMAGLLADNIDYITKSGIWYKGKAEVIRHDQINQQTIFKSSTLTIDSMHVKYVKPDLAIVYVGWGISGDLHHNGTPSAPRHGIYTWVLLNESGKWRMISFNNVDIVTPL